MLLRVCFWLKIKYSYGTQLSPFRHSHTHQTRVISRFHNQPHLLVLTVLTFPKPFYQLCWNPRLAVFKCLSSVHLSGFRQNLSLPTPPTDHTGHHTPMAAGLWSSSWSLSPGRAPSKPMKIHFFTGQNQVQSKDIGLGLSKRSRRRSSKSTPIAWYQVLKSPHPQQCLPSSALPVLWDQKQWFC